MNDTMGRYIDSLDDEARDRIVRAQGWIDGGCFRHESPDAPMCLMQHVLGREAYFEAPYDGLSPAWKFDAAVYRFGLDRVVRAVKLRAGADPSELLAEPADFEAVR